MLIFPLAYNKLDINESIQQIYPHYILLSKNRWVENSNLSFEVSGLDEKKMIQLDENFFLYPEPFTFAKVKAIYFQTEGQMKNSVANITISTSPFPKQLLKVDENVKSIPLPKKRRIAKPKRSLTREIKLFSSYLGALSVAKNVIGKEVKFPKSRYFTEPKYREIEKLVLRRQPNQNDIERFGKREKIKLELYLFQFYNLEIIEKKDSLTYLAIILEKYRYQMNDNLAGLIEQNKNLDKDLQETFILLYGLMLGYNKLPYKRKVNTKFKFDKDEDF